MKNTLPKRRYTASREAYWRGMFNDFAQFDTDHAVSGWSAQGLALRMAAYLRILPSFKLQKNARVLDLGCGAGAYSRILGKAGFNTAGIDFAYQVVQKASRKNTQTHVQFLSGDATCLPLADTVFDHVLCIGLFQSLHNHSSALKEIIRVLKPNGVMCLMTLNQRCLKHRIDRLLQKEEIIMVDDRPQPRLKTYEPEIFKKELYSLGFDRIRLQPVQIYPEALNRMAGLIQIWNRFAILNYLTARSFMVCAYKP